MKLFLYNPLKSLREFHQKFNVKNFIECDDQYEREKTIAVRRALILEEATEVSEAIAGGKLDEIAKELADLLYVTYGAAEVFNIPLYEIFNEVHRSNMSKLGVDGKPVLRADGKILKGPNYTEADVARILRG